MKRSTFKTASLLVCVGAFLVFSLCGFVEAKDPEIVVGEVEPLTGILAYGGNQMRQGGMLAVEEINANGGIKSMAGAKLKLMYGDSQGKPEIGASEAERLIREGAVALIGAYQSSVGLATTQAAERARVPHIVSSGGVQKMTERGFKYTFRICPGFDFETQCYVDYVLALARESNVKIETTALIHENTAFGTDIARYLGKKFPRVGVQVLANIAYPYNTGDLTAEVTKIKALNPDLVVATTYYPDGILLLRAMKELRVKPTVFNSCVGSAFSKPSFVKEMGDLSEHLMDLNYGYNLNSPIAKKVFAAYEKKYGQKMSNEAAHGYEAVKILADALERGKSAEQEKVRQALAKTNYNGSILPVKGALKFDAKGQANCWPVFFQIQGQEIQVVWPDEFSTAKPVFPMEYKW
jgi:branched-chain amino acid transport system substrate-binding protein